MPEWGRQGRSFGLQYFMFLEEVAIDELLVGILLRGKKLDGKAIELEIAYRGRATARVGQVDAERVVRGVKTSAIRSPMRVGHAHTAKCPNRFRLCRCLGG